MAKLLSPAGSFQSLRAAIEAGADEVYLGGQDFNARAGAKNFSPSQLVGAAELCAKNNVGFLYALNTLVSDREMEKALKTADFLQKEAPPDAYIVQDPGFAAELKKSFPEVVLHASTQLAQHSGDGFALLRSLGFARVVLAREMSFPNLKKTVSPLMETEIFIHGALCVSQSGGCLMSSMIGKRSGNKGECAQPCRLSYGAGKYPLSLKELCLAEHIPELLDSGITAFKIEGRMRPPAYVAAVTSVYRTLIDQKRAASETELKILSGAFSRGFTDGYFTGRKENMFGVRTENVAAGKITASPVIIREKPGYAPLPFILPVKEPRRIFPASQQNGYVLRFADPSVIKKLPAEIIKAAARIDINLTDYSYAPEYAEKVCCVLPRVIFPSDKKAVAQLIKSAENSGIRHFSLSNIADIELCGENFIHGDYPLNAYNSKTLGLLEALSFSSVTISPETSPGSLKPAAAAGEYIVYGRLPLMHTENCIIKNASGCKKPRCSSFLTDRTNADFLLLREYGHRNILYNSVPVYLLDKIKEIKKAGAGLHTLLFTDETPGEIVRLTGCYKNKTAPEGKFTRAYYNG